MKAFTVLEMLLVMCIIAVVFVLTLPNIQQKRDIINNKGCEALLEVVNAQILLYDLENGDSNVNIEDLIDKGYIKEQQGKCPNGKSITIVDMEAVSD